jgi:hypothetical protein
VAPAVDEANALDAHAKSFVILILPESLCADYEEDILRRIYLSQGSSAHSTNVFVHNTAERVLTMQIL